MGMNDFVIGLPIDLIGLTYSTTAKAMAFMYQLLNLKLNLGSKW